MHSRLGDILDQADGDLPGLPSFPVWPHLPSPILQVLIGGSLTPLYCCEGLRLLNTSALLLPPFQDLHLNSAIQDPNSSSLRVPVPGTVRSRGLTVESVHSRETQGSHPAWRASRGGSKPQLSRCGFSGALAWPQFSQQKNGTIINMHFSTPHFCLRGVS